MPRLCNTQAKATPHAYRARRTIPLFTQLYVARAHTLKWCVCACHHYGLVPSLRLPVLSPYVSLSRCACACCVLLLLRRTHTHLCVLCAALRECHTAAHHSVCPHGISRVWCVCACVYACGWLQTCLITHPWQNNNTAVREHARTR